MIIGKEFKTNFGGDSHFACPNCRERLCVHISHKNEDNPTRYFCKMCGTKYELKPSTNVFLEIYHGELGNKGFKNILNDSPESVID